MLIPGVSVALVDCLLLLRYEPLILDSAPNSFLNYDFNQFNILFDEEAKNVKPSGNYIVIQMKSPLHKQSQVCCDNGTNWNDQAIHSVCFSFLPTFHAQLTFVRC